MDRIEAVKQAFIEASEGYRKAREEILDATDYPDNFSLSALAPIAAEIYKQLTGTVVVEVGSKARTAHPDTLERLREQFETMGVKANVFVSQDIKMRNLGNEQVIRIIIETPEGEVTEDGA